MSIRHTVIVVLGASVCLWLATAVSVARLLAPHLGLLLACILSPVIATGALASLLPVAIMLLAVFHIAAIIYSTTRK